MIQITLLAQVITLWGLSVEMLGEVIYPHIVLIKPESAGKITGMILELDNVEILHLLDNAVAFDLKVMEAIRVLDDAERLKAARTRQRGSPVARFKAISS